MTEITFNEIEDIIESSTFRINKTYNGSIFVHNSNQAISAYNNLPKQQSIIASSQITL